MSEVSQKQLAANRKNAKKKDDKNKDAKAVNGRRRSSKKKVKNQLKDWRKFLKPKIEPRHEEVFKLMFEKGVWGMGKAMRMAGYSDSYSKNPNHVSQTKSWQRLVEERFPELRV